MEEVFFVYRHVCPNGKCYVGITGKPLEHRWRKGKGYDTQLFGKAIKKYGWENIKHEVLCECSTLAEACKKEIEMISFYKSFDRRFGYNKSLGGNGGFGHTFAPTKEWKMAMSQKHKEAMMGDIDLYNNASEQCRKNAQKRSMPVVQMDLCGNEIATYKSAKEAFEKTGTGFGNILHCCYGRRNKANGYKWRFANTDNSGRETAI